jgi:HD-GYP domain-containing protein (c-di-GMP phosphodiesterase class II)
VGFIHNHTVIGERILNAALALEPVAKLVRSTHERYDGAGYPDGLAGEQIPLPSRIVFACDGFLALTTRRPYGHKMSEAEARAELRRGAGSQFDPHVIDALLAELDDSTPNQPQAEPELSGTRHASPGRAGLTSIIDAASPVIAHCGVSEPPAPS